MRHNLAELVSIEHKHRITSGITLGIDKLVTRINHLWISESFNSLYSNAVSDRFIFIFITQMMEYI